MVNIHICASRPPFLVAWITGPMWKTRPGWRQYRPHIAGCGGRNRVFFAMGTDLLHPMWPSPNHSWAKLEFWWWTPDVHGKKSAQTEHTFKVKLAPCAGPLGWGWVSHFSYPTSIGDDYYDADDAAADDDDDDSDMITSHGIGLHHRRFYLNMQLFEVSHLRPNVESCKELCLRKSWRPKSSEKSLLQKQKIDGVCDCVFTENNIVLLVSPEQP